MLGACIACDHHPRELCSCKRYWNGREVGWFSEKVAYSAMPLASELLHEPFLVTKETLPKLLTLAVEHHVQGEDGGLRQLCMALGEFLNSFPMPFLMYDAGGDETD